MLVLLSSEVGTQEAHERPAHERPAHERPAEHHYYMYEYHAAAVVVVLFILLRRDNDNSGCMILKGTNTQHPGLASRAKLEKFTSGAVLDMTTYEYWFFAFFAYRLCTAAGAGAVEVQR